MCRLGAYTRGPGSWLIFERGDLATLTIMVCAWGLDKIELDEFVQLTSKLQMVQRNRLVARCVCVCVVKQMLKRSSAKAKKVFL